MGRYADLTFLREADTPNTGEMLVFAESRSVHLIAFAVSAGIAAILLSSPFGYFGLVDWPRLPGFIAFLIGPFIGVFALLYYGSMRSSFSSSNWILRATPDGLYVKFRSFRNRHLAEEDDVVVHIPKREVHCLRRYGRRSTTIDSDGSEIHERRTMLEIRLHGKDTERLKKQLNKERQPRKAKGKNSHWHHRHYPVRLRAAGVVTIDWTAPDTVVRPGINRALTQLSRWYRIAGDDAVADPRLQDQNAEQQEAQLVEMVERGDTIAAVKMARHLYGYDITEAKAFIDGLAGR